MKNLQELAVKMHTPKPPELAETPLLRTRMNAYPVPVREGESAIDSLVEGPDGRIYGATSGRNCDIFAFCNILGKRVKAVASIPGPAVAENSLAIDDGMNLYAGVTSEDADGTLHGVLHSMKIDVSLSRFEEAVGETGFAVVRPPRRLLEPVPGEGIRCLLHHKGARSIIGVTTPGTKLFKYSIDTGECVVVAEISPGRGIVARSKGRLVSRCLLEMPDACVYGTGEGGHFFKYDVAAGEVSYFACRVPSMLVRRDWNSAECLCSGGDGNIYGGTTDGYLFKFSPATGSVVNFGKPSLERPLGGLVHKDGVLYGVCGSGSGVADMFSYDLAKAHFEDLGMINYVPCEGGDCDMHSLTPWSAWRIGPVIKDSYGTIYLGESDSKGHLFTFRP